MLLLDEPLSSLDVETRSEIRRMLRAHLGEFEGPRLLVTHDPADAFLLADRIDVIEAGRITQSGSPDDDPTLTGDPVRRCTRRDQPVRRRRRQRDRPTPTITTIR